MHTSGGCGKLKTWQNNQEKNFWFAMNTEQSQNKGGRPSKQKKTLTGFSSSAAAQHAQSTVTSAPVFDGGMDITEEAVNEKAAESYRAEVELSTDRFIACCRSNFCSTCIYADQTQCPACLQTKPSVQHAHSRSLGARR